MRPELGKPGSFGPRSVPTIQRWRVAKSPPQEVIEGAANAEALRTLLQDERPEAWSATANAPAAAVEHLIILAPL